jgi:hypothetical protein
VEINTDPPMTSGTVSGFWAMKELYAIVDMFGRTWFLMPKGVNASLMLIKTRIWLRP